MRRAPLTVSSNWNMMRWFFGEILAFSYPAASVAVLPKAHAGTRPWAAIHASSSVLNVVAAPPSAPVSPCVVCTIPCGNPWAVMNSRVRATRYSGRAVRYIGR